MTEFFPAKVTAEGEIIPLDDIERMVESLDNYDERNDLGKETE